MSSQTVQTGHVMSVRTQVAKAARPALRGDITGENIVVRAREERVMIWARDHPDVGLIRVVGSRVGKQMELNPFYKRLERRRLAENLVKIVEARSRVSNQQNVTDEIGIRRRLKNSVSDEEYKAYRDQERLRYGEQFASGGRIPVVKPPERRSVLLLQLEQRKKVLADVEAESRGIEMKLADIVKSDIISLFGRAIDVADVGDVDAKLKEYLLSGGDRAFGNRQLAAQDAQTPDAVAWGIRLFQTEPGSYNIILGNSDVEFNMNFDIWFGEVAYESIELMFFGINLETARGFVRRYVDRARSCSIYGDDMFFAELENYDSVRSLENDVLLSPEETCSGLYGGAHPVTTTELAALRLLTSECIWVRPGWFKRDGAEFYCPLDGMTLHRECLNLKVKRASILCPLCCVILSPHYCSDGKLDGYDHPIGVDMENPLSDVKHIGERAHGVEPCKHTSQSSASSAQSTAPSVASSVGVSVKASVPANAAPVCSDQLAAVLQGISDQFCPQTGHAEVQTEIPYEQQYETWLAREKSRQTWGQWFCGLLGINLWNFPEWFLHFYPNVRKPMDGRRLSQEESARALSHVSGVDVGPSEVIVTEGCITPCTPDRRSIQMQVGTRTLDTDLVVIQVAPNANYLLKTMMKTGVELAGLVTYSLITENIINFVRGRITKLIAGVVLVLGGLAGGLSVGYRLQRRLDLLRVPAQDRFTYCPALLNGLVTGSAVTCKTEADLRSVLEMKKNSYNALLIDSLVWPTVGDSTAVAALVHLQGKNF